MTCAITNGSNTKIAGLAKPTESVGLQQPSEDITKASAGVTIDTSLEHVLLNRVTVYRKPKAADPLS